MGQNTELFFKKGQMPIFSPIGLLLAKGFSSFAQISYLWLIAH